MFVTVTALESALDVLASCRRALAKDLTITDLATTTAPRMSVLEQLLSAEKGDTATSTGAREA